MKRGPVAVVGWLIFLVLAGRGAAVRDRHELRSALPLLGRDDVPRAPAGVRIRVQVVNTTRTRGLGRRATQLLRDRGFDVVEVGTAGPARDTTLVLDRSGHA